jgi:hypothetical protein
MAPFALPDPSVQTQVINPETGDLWEYVDGVWMVADSGDPGYEPPDEDDDPPAGDSDCITNATVATLRAEISSLQADIIQLRAELVSATTNNFLILE